MYAYLNVEHGTGTLQTEWSKSYAGEGYSKCSLHLFAKLWAVSIKIVLIFALCMEQVWLPFYYPKLKSYPWLLCFTTLLLLHPSTAFLIVFLYKLALNGYV